jgi:protocatechuate 3,4-dioxygenase beta subunit
MPKRSQPKSRSVKRAATARKAARPRDFEQAITAIVQSRISPKTPARLKRVMNSLIKHLHDFVRDVELTEAEWWTAIDFLTRTGQMCDDKRQEFILLSDTMGVTMLTDAINHRKAGNATESTIFGPFYRGGAPELPFGGSIQSAAGGEPAVLTGRVLDTRGKPIANATLDVWETDDDGMYDSQVGDGSQLNLRGVFRTNARGEYKIVAIKPVPYPIPSDGPVGQMLKALGRHPYRPAHIHVIAAAAGYEAVTTHIFASDSKYLDGDAVFGVKDSLIADFVVNRSASAAAGHGVSAPFYDVRFDFVLQKANKKASKRRFTT